MLFNVGDYVTRISHNHDLVFKIKDIINNVAILEGVNIRLLADSKIDDLKKEEGVTNDDEEILDRFGELDLNRDEFFYLPGKILHIDSDKDSISDFQVNNILLHW